MGYLLDVILWLTIIVVVLALVLAIVGMFMILTKGFMLALEQATKDARDER